MKSIRLIGTSALFLILGLGAPAYARQDKPDDHGGAAAAKPAHGGQTRGAAANDSQTRGTDANGGQTRSTAAAGEIDEHRQARDASGATAAASQAANSIRTAGTRSADGRATANTKIAARSAGKRQDFDSHT
jgi:hypothetical protein